MDIEIANLILSGAKYLAAAIALLGMGRVAVGIGGIFSSLIAETSRNPGVKKDIFVYSLIGAALAESIALYILVISLIILFV